MKVLKLVFIYFFLFCCEEVIISSSPSRFVFFFFAFSTMQGLLLSNTNYCDPFCFAQCVVIVVNFPTRKTEHKEKGKIKYSNVR